MKLKHLLLGFAAMTILVGCEKEVAVTGIAVDTATMTLTTAGQKDTLTATLAPADAKGTVVWSSSNTAIATVEGNGLTAVVTAVGNGTAKIMASIDIFSAECAVTVNIGGASGDGEGSEAKPYSVAQAIANQGSLKWVEGYIVGYVNGLGIADAVFGVPTDVAQTEVLIASSASEKNISNCLPIQLPAGAVRNGLDLFANPTILGKYIKLYGSLEAYFNQAGMKNTAYYELEGGATGGTKPVANAILNETFAAGQGDFTIVDVIKPTALTSVWYYNATYKQMAAGAYKDNTNHESESWLISPQINLSSVSSATFTFEHAGKQFGAPVSNLTIQVSKTYSSGNINSADWTALSIPDHLAGETNTFKPSGNIDLTPYCGNSNVRVAFKYTSTTTGAGNWYVRNVVVK